MRFKSQQHKSTFKKAIRKKDKKDTRLMAAMYLLTADQILWNKVKGNIRESRIDFDEVRLDTVSENGYTLYSASKDMYFNTDHVSISDIFDTNLISEKMFNVIITAINIRRLGLEKAEAIEYATARICIPSAAIPFAGSRMKSKKPSTITSPTSKWKNISATTMRKFSAS